MTNDYRDAYKPVEGIPPPPRAPRYPASLNLDEMADRLSPENARSVLAFMEAHGCTNQMPERIIEKLVHKTTLIQSDPAPARETSTDGTPTGVVEAGSPGLDLLIPPKDGLFPDGSRLNDDSIPF